MPKTAAKAKTVFICQQCGNTSPKWMGRCPDCGEWNTLVETTLELSLIHISEPTRPY